MIAKPDPDLPDPKRTDRMRAKAGELVRRELRGMRREREQEAQDRVREVREPPAAGDYGPAIVRARGERYATEIPDIDRPDVRDRSVKAARVRCIYADLWAEGRIDHAQREAADRLAIQWEAMLGASTDVGGSPGWQRSTVPERRLQAAQDLREVERLLGVLDGKWTVLVVAYNVWPLGGPDVPRLVRTLQALAEFWGME